MSSFNPFTHPGLTDFNSPLGMLEWIWLNRPESPPRKKANTAAQGGASKAGRMGPLQLVEDTLSEDGDDDQEDLDNEKIFDCIKFNEDDSGNEGDATPVVAPTSESQSTGFVVDFSQSAVQPDANDHTEYTGTESGGQATATVPSNGGEHNTAAESTDMIEGETKDEEHTEALDLGTTDIVEALAVDVHTDVSAHAIGVSSESSVNSSAPSTARLVENGKGKGREREIEIIGPIYPSTTARAPAPSISQYTEPHVRSKRTYDETFEGAWSHGEKRARMETVGNPAQTVIRHPIPGYAVHGQGAQVTAHTPEMAFWMGHGGGVTAHEPGYPSYAAHNHPPTAPYVSQAPPPMGYPSGQVDHRYYGHYAYPMHTPSPVSYAPQSAPQMEQPGTLDRRNLGNHQYQMSAPPPTMAWTMPPQSHHYPPAVCSYAPTLAAPQPQMAASTSQANIIQRTVSTPDNYGPGSSHSFAQWATYPYPSNTHVTPYTAASSPAGSSRSTPSIEDQQQPPRVASAPPAMLAKIPVAPARDWDQVPFTSRRAKGSRRIASNSRVRAQVAGSSSSASLTTIPEDQVAGSSSSASLTTIPEDQDAGAPPKGGNVSFRTSTQKN